MRSRDVALIVIAKAPLAGFSKTRLCPPCTPEQAALVARAALSDTLAAVASTPCRRRVLALEGAVGDWLVPGFDVVAQRGDGLDERLAAAFEIVDGPALLVGMDTPQLSPTLLMQATAELVASGTDAVLGLAADGGFWCIGLREPAPDALLGIPMSTSFTGAAQQARLTKLGVSTRLLPQLRDVDTFADALEVAATAPDTHFARAMSSLDLDELVTT